MGSDNEIYAEKKILSTFCKKMSTITIKNSKNR